MMHLERWRGDARTKRILLLILSFRILSFPILAALTSFAIADSTTVGFTQRIGEQLPRSLSLTDDNGSPVRIDHLLRQRPAILLFNYYRCENVCGVMIDKTLGALHASGLRPGSDVALLIVSIDPRETAMLAAAKKNAFGQRYGKPFIDGTHFLTGNEASLAALQKSAGFNARFDAQKNQYIHPTGLIFLTPQARISSYEFGLPDASELKKNIAVAMRGDTRSITDSIASICQHLLPLSNSRSALILHALRGAVAAIAGIAVIAIAVFRKRRSAR